MSNTKTAISSPMDEAFDHFEASCLHGDHGYAPVEFDIKEAVVNGFYIRQARVPAGSVFTSETHRFEHVFSMSQGVIWVTNEQGERSVIEAPANGVTPAGARRLVYVEEEVVWTTFHQIPEGVDSNDTGKIASALIEGRQNPLLSEGEGHAWKEALS